VDYRFEGRKYKSRPITANVQGILDDIKKLGDYSNKAVLFIVFPATHNHKKMAKSSFEKNKIKKLGFRNPIFPLFR